MHNESEIRDAVVAQVRCRNCGSTVDQSRTECEYCFTALRIVTFKNITNLGIPIAQNLARSYSTDANKYENKIALSLLFLRLKQFEKSQKFASDLIDADPGNDEAYFVHAIAALGGKKPFLCPRSTIDIALQSADAAYAIKQLAIYKTFSAIIKYDYFYRKGFRHEPDYKEELFVARSIGIGSGDMDELLSLVRFDVTPEFRFHLEEM